MVKDLNFLWAQLNDLAGYKSGKASALRLWKSQIWEEAIRQSYLEIVSV